MKKKPLAEVVIAPEIMQMAKQSVQSGRPVATKKCAVCGASSTPLAGPPSVDEDLCWVCRRLKISAWRETDGQIAAQE